MLKIGICATPTERKKIKLSLSQYFKKANVDATINYIDNRNNIFNTLYFGYDYSLIIISDSKGLSYIKKISSDYDKKNMKLIYGFLEEPFDSDDCDEIILRSVGHLCPHGVFRVNNSKSFRLVLHENIEYFHWDGNKTILHLLNNETEEISLTIKKIYESLSEPYFVECFKGCIVNLFNIKKIDKVTKELVMKSGTRIPFSRKKYNVIVRSLIQAVYGLMK